MDLEVRVCLIFRSGLCRKYDVLVLLKLCW